MSPSSGIFLSTRSKRSLMSPPITTVWPSLTVTVVVARRRVTTGELKFSEICVVCSERREISGSSCMRTKPSGLIDGVTVRMTPMSSGDTLDCWPALEKLTPEGRRIVSPTCR